VPCRCRRRSDGAREPGHAPDVTDDGPGDDRSDAEDVSEGGAGGPDRGGELLLGFAELVVEVAQAGEELGGELGAGQLDGTGWVGPLAILAA